jgi:hypothetical protein
MVLHTGEKMPMTKQEVNTLLGITDLDGRIILKYVLNK